MTLSARTRSILFPLAAVVAVLLACNGGGSSGGGGETDDDGGGPVSQACADATFDLGTASAQPSGSTLLCVYETEVEGYDDCTLTRTTVSGSGTSPSSVTFTRSNSDDDQTRTSTPSGSWSAFTNGLNCSNPLGCLNGDYEIQLSFANIDACPTGVELELQIP